MELTKIRKSRASSSEMARIYRKRGHNDADEFAYAIGLSHGYQNDLTAKKDVIDPSGDAHSVKSGEKKWQIFLYGKQRFLSDEAFRVMNGIGDLLVKCIDSFPPTFKEYQENKDAAKERLRVPMRLLMEKLKDKARLRAFFKAAIFNANQVDYLTIKHNGKFHIFLNTDVLNVIENNINVANSIARTRDQRMEQKVLFKYKGINLAELEMRNDSLKHYRQIRFNMVKPKMVHLLFKMITLKKEHNSLVYVYGNAAKKFGRWNKNYK